MRYQCEKSRVVQDKRERYSWREEGHEKKHISIAICKLINYTHTAQPQIDRQLSVIHQYYFSIYIYININILRVLFCLAYQLLFTVRGRRIESVYLMACPLVFLMLKKNDSFKLSPHKKKEDTRQGGCVKHLRYCQFFQTIVRKSSVHSRRD